MAYTNGTGADWHTNHGGALPFRPPTVEEALPYSPFTSIVPFSPDIIPYPTTAPPTPPTTLKPEEQTAGRKALSILDHDLKNDSSASRTLHGTLQQLRSLLDGDGLSEFNFKTPKHLPTPSPEHSANVLSNGANPPKPTNLSSFAARLLNETDIAFRQHSAHSQSHAHSRSSTGPLKLSSAPNRAQTSSQARTTPPSNAMLASRAIHPTHNGSPSPALSSTPGHTGPSVVVHQLPTVKKEEYQRYDTIQSADAKRHSKRDQPDDAIAAMKPEERQIAESLLQDLEELIARISAGRDSPEEATFFTTCPTDEGDIIVMELKTLKGLAERVQNVIDKRCFSSVPQEQVLLVQSFCEPLVTGTIHTAIELDASEIEDAPERLHRAIAGLQASKLVLKTMTETLDDRRSCSEDLVQSIIRLLKKAFEQCVIPIVDARPSSDSELFDFAKKHRKAVMKLVQCSGDVLSLLALLIGKIKLTTMALSPLASIAIEIIFAQNSERDADSALGGIQKFESFRQRSMDVLAQIFSFHVDQRESISNEVLSNLEKLPEKRASARQFKSSRDPSIMLVSALFMRFVQAAASRTSHQLEIEYTGKGDLSEDDSSEESDRGAHTLPSKSSAGASLEQTAKRLWQYAMTTASQIARYLVNRASNVSKSGDKPFRILLDLFIEDFCNLLGSPEWPAASILLSRILSIMVGIVDHDPKRKDKPSVNAVDMALAVMSNMASGILDFKHRIRDTKRKLDISQSEISSRFIPLSEDALSGPINSHDLLLLNGPFDEVLRSIPDYLKYEGPEIRRKDPYLLSLTSFYLIFWANNFFVNLKSTKEVRAIEDGENRTREKRNESVERTELHLKKIAMDPTCLPEQSSILATEDESKLAAGIITSQETFCQYFRKLIYFLINNTTNASAKLKSRAITSLSSLIDKDPQTLDENTFPHIAKLLEDSSPAVRSSTLTLIAKCLAREPALERYCLKSIVNIMADPISNEPKKKAIRLLGDICAGLTGTEQPIQEKKRIIARELLLPILDNEKSVAELARQTLEDIWLSSSSNPNASQQQIELRQRVELIVGTLPAIQSRLNSEEYMKALETFFARSVSAETKNAANNFRTLLKLVAAIVDQTTDSNSNSTTSSPEMSQAQLLRSLAFFAKISPKLFTAEQVQRLKMYIQNLQNSAELAQFQPTVVIFRHVFPSLPSLQEAFLEDVRSSLQKVVPKLAQNAGLAILAADNSRTAENPKAAEAEIARWKNTLLDVAHCLWTIAPLINDPVWGMSGLGKLFTMATSSAIKLDTAYSIPVKRMATDSPNQDEDKIKKMKASVSLLLILGSFGKVCDFDKYVETFGKIIKAQVDKSIRGTNEITSQKLQRFRSWKGPTVTTLFLDIVLPFIKQSWDSVVRAQALCTLGDICQQNPKHFTRAEIDKAFKIPFINQEQNLMLVVITQMRDFLASAENRSDTGAEIAVGEGAVHGAERLESSFAASDKDSATMHLARGFLKHIVDCALRRSDDMAHVATDIIVSVSRQGLVHPKECGPPLVALSTSPDAIISQKAAAEHQTIHRQHETMFEKEYVSAVQMAFEYQREVHGTYRGMVEATSKPKMQLLFGVLKEGSRKVLRKFISNLFRELNFEELSKLDTDGIIPEPIQFARFCLENFALFDYARADEVYHVVATIESIVLKQTGPAVALAIETDFPQTDSDPNADVALSDGVSADIARANEAILESHVSTSETLSISNERLRLLAVASVILHMMWETRLFIRRAWNVQEKVASKDVQKPAVRNNLIPGKEFYEKLSPIIASLNDRESMVKECRALAEIINVDKEHAIEEVEEPVDAGYETPDEDEKEAHTPTSGKSRKRKGSTVADRTPKKARGRPSAGKGKKRSSRTPELDDWD